MATTDTSEWRLVGTTLAASSTDKILPVINSHFYFVLNESGSGEVSIPLDSAAAGVVTEGMLAVLYYRGAIRGSFLIENIRKVPASTQEEAGQVLSLSGRGGMTLLDRAIVWSDGTTATTRTFTATKAGVLIALITEAQARGGLGALTYDFTATNDSDAVAWTDSDEYKLTVGTTLLDVLRQFAKTGIEFEMIYSGTGFVLSAYKNGIGTDKSSSVYFRTGTNCQEIDIDQRGNDIKNALLVTHEAGAVTVSDSTSITANGRREELLDARYAQSTSSALTYGAAILATKKDTRIGRTIKVYDGVPPYAFVNYILGDNVTLDVEGVLTDDRILGIQCDFADGEYSNVVIELNELMLDQQLKMRQDLNTLTTDWQKAHDANLLEVAEFGALTTDVLGLDGIDGTVYAVEIYSEYLYVGGSFSKVGELTVNNIARYHIPTGRWSKIGDSTAFATVNAIKQMGGNIYAVGLWETSPDAFEHAPVRKWNTSTNSWSEIGDVAYNSLTSSLGGQALATDGTNLYVGGDFIDNIDGTSIQSTVAKWTGTVWTNTGAVTDANTLRCWALDYFDGTLYGGFAPNIPNVGHGLQKQSGSWTNINGSLPDEVFALSHTTSNLIVGHEDEVYLYNTTDGLVKIGTVDSAGASYVLSVFGYLEDVYIGGEFGTVEGATGFQTIAKYSGGIWTKLGLGLTKLAGQEARCYAIVGDSSKFFFGGDFVTAGNLYAGNIAGWFTSFQAYTDYLAHGGNSASFDMGAAIHSAPASAVTDADEFPFWEDVSDALAKITWANIKATLKTYLDTLYVSVTQTANRILISDGTGAVTTDADLTWDKTTNTLTINGDIKSPAGATAGANGTDLDINAGAGNTTGRGGGAYLWGGSSSAGDGGLVDVGAGSGGSPNGAGGYAILYSGAGQGSSAGGYTGIYGGDSVDGAAGKVEIIPGSATGAGANANVEIKRAKFTTPDTAYTNTKANIEAIASPVTGMRAVATDTGESGHYNGAAWIWGSGGSAAAVEYDRTFMMMGA